MIEINKLKAWAVSKGYGQQKRNAIFGEKPGVYPSENGMKAN